MISRLFILLLIVGCVFAQDSPCQDETYLELKKKNLDKMSDREYEYFKRKDTACEKWQLNQQELLAKLDKNIPTKSVLENMSHVEKMVLYETKKINMFETFSDSEIGAMSMRGRIILWKGLAISYTPFILGLLANKSNQELVYFAMLGNYITLGVLVHDIHKQKELYNDKLYKKIFLTD